MTIMVIMYIQIILYLFTCSARRPLLNYGFGTNTNQSSNKKNTKANQNTKKNLRIIIILYVDMLIGNLFILNEGSIMQGRVPLPLNTDT
jgi:hypothetical protein